ncbi:hypothetical protein SAMN04488100_12621 [Alkalibacterium putridalgicola]|uniref:Uncharacterized protein n=1 Tax=Alkalibacterium putridalgicola TaxID=426703 RepID=A0A1H7VPY1_9LACT|nr:hypothetical protein [Alkalibacterium putridalgicola]GEK89849.1 hypothetical protein APU01nite_18880 [Alkalibacterium putridalgicola]SEM11240.1 hypothetical protein SAMN04488100_12621 [Alkalibacterium putridalgicola]
MKKFLAYTAIAIGSLAVLVLIGVFVVSLFQARLETSNERLESREEERSSLEDRWLDAHENDESVTLVIEDVSIDQSSGTLEWSDSQGEGGIVYFSIASDDSIIFSEADSEFPKNMPSYPQYFREAIIEEMDK